jgi:guanosine-3',5'-bis(diphosphate) 3'-pyrophosphohydrolase
MNLVLKAIEFATKKHKGQTRKFSGDRYVTHPLAVSYLVSSFKKSKHLDEILAACWLHDTLEDTNTTFVELAKEFTPLTASLVHEMTNDETIMKVVGKREYMAIKLVGISSYALVIKLADRLHNISDNPTDKMKEDTKYLLERLEKYRKLSKTHKSIIKEIKIIIDKKYL